MNTPLPHLPPPTVQEWGNSCRIASSGRAKRQKTVELESKNKSRRGLYAVDAAALSRKTGFLSSAIGGIALDNALARISAGARRFVIFTDSLKRPTWNRIFAFQSAFEGERA